MLSLVLAALQALAGTPARPHACTPARINSPAELRAALDSLPAAADVEQRVQAIAMIGTPVVGWALDLAADTTGATPAATRAGALRVLRYARWKPAVPQLVRLAQPLKGDWVVWRGALQALAVYPYLELVPWWLDMITFPRRVVREDALRGLALTGDARVIPMVNESVHHENDAATQALVADVVFKLRQPIAVRDTARFAWPPDSLGGRYLPKACLRG